MTSIKTRNDGKWIKYEESGRAGIINLPIPGSKCGFLTGTKSVNFVNGQASFNDLSLNISTSGHFLRFTTNARGYFQGPYHDKLPRFGAFTVAVSYTHLTLPTNREV